MGCTIKLGTAPMPASVSNQLRCVRTPSTRLFSILAACIDPRPCYPASNLDTDPWASASASVLPAAFDLPVTCRARATAAPAPLPAPDPSERPHSRNSQCDRAVPADEATLRADHRLPAMIVSDLISPKRESSVAGRNSTMLHFALQNFDDPGRLPARRSARSRTCSTPGTLPSWVPQPASTSASTCREAPLSCSKST